MFVRWEHRGESFRASLEARIRRNGKVVSVSVNVGSPPVYLTRQRAGEIAQRFANEHNGHPAHNADFFYQEIEGIRLLEAEQLRVTSPHINYIAILKRLGEPVLDYYFQAGSYLPVLINDQVATLRKCDALWAQIAQIYYRVLTRFFFGIFLGIVDQNVNIETIANAAYIFPVTVFSVLEDHANWLHQRANGNAVLPHGLNFVQALFLAGLKEFHDSLAQYHNVEDFVRVLAADIVDLYGLGGEGIAVNVDFFNSLRQYTKQNVEQVLQMVMVDYGSGSAVGERNYVSQAISAWGEWQTSNCKGWC